MTTKIYLFYKPAELVDFDLPASVRDDTTELEAKIRADYDFRHKFDTDSNVKECFFFVTKTALARPFVPSVVPSEWQEAKWIIVRALLNRAQLEIDQKERFKRFLRFIDGMERRIIALAYINERIRYIMAHMNNFKRHSDSVHEMLAKAYESYLEIPDLEVDVDPPASMPKG